MKLKIKEKLINTVLVLPIVLSLSLSGCVYLIIGGLGAVGGYVVSPDTVEGVAEYDSQDVWDVSRKLVSIMGIVEEEFVEGGVLRASVHNVQVTITIIPLNEHNTKLRVKARKSFVPKITIAQDVFVKIITNLDEMDMILDRDSGDYEDY